MKHPKGIVQNKENNIISYSNRGMALEDDLNVTNNYYIDKKIAFIYKKPTPIQIVKTSFNPFKITEAFFKEASTTDYNGIYKGYYIDYDAKETNNKTSFPLNNIHKHQLNHLKNIDSAKGIAFLIIRFNKLNRTYLITYKDIENFITNYNRKSIPLSYFEKHAHLIKEGYIPRLNYIEIIDKLLEEL